MAKHNSKGRSKTDGKHVRHYKWQLETPAYRSLSPYGRCLLMEIKLRYYDDNNGKVSMSVREAAERLNCAVNTASKAFHELISKGFLKPNLKGSFNWKTKHATTWILTEYKYNGNLPTKEFMNWKMGKTVSPRDTEKQKETGRERKKPVSPRNTDDTISCDREISTVSPRNTYGITSCDRGGQNEPIHGITSCYTNNIPYNPARRAASSKLSLAGGYEQSKPSNNSAHSILAERLGDGETGWLILMSLTPTTIDSLVAKNESGMLTDADIATAQLEANMNARSADHG